MAQRPLIKPVAACWGIMEGRMGSNMKINVQISIQCSLRYFELGADSIEGGEDTREWIGYMLNMINILQSFLTMSM